MIRNVISGKYNEVTPDILIPYQITGDELRDSFITLIAVRPETNIVRYEAAIIKSIEPYADVIYMASLSGNLLNDKAIIACHYSSQLQFAIEGKKEMGKYPEMVKQFEEKFKVSFQDAMIIGAFGAILEYKIKKNADQLFELMVPETDFLEMYGHTIKKINGYYILDYDIPAIITRHHKNTAVFIIAVKLKNNSYRFCGIHHLIYENMRRDTRIKIPDLKKRRHLPWYDQIRRIYHISRSHIEAMFDLTDYVFKNKKERIGYAYTPLGQLLLDMGIFTGERLEERLSALKDNPLVYLNQEDGSLKLVNIISEGKIRKASTFLEKDLEACAEIINQINWEKSHP
jgi:hypothetical protein